ncbi:MAG: toprim domain-containing protein [Campylobacterales bacterium]|nr:toprim domain-containing protein [Campylobacterales bacterium]
MPDDFMIPHRIDAQNNRQVYLAELKQLFLGDYDGKKLLAAEWQKILEMAKKYDIGFNKKSGRLIMPIRDIDDKIRTFWKYKKNGADFVKEDGKVIKHRKVLYTKNKPRPPFAILDVIEFAKTPDIPVFITEGEKDALIANANVLRAICIGGAGASKRIKEEYLRLFNGLKIIIAGDYDEAGIKFNQNILEQLKPIAKTVTVLRWEQKSKQDGFKLHKKFDIADYFAWKNNK